MAATYITRTQTILDEIIGQPPRDSTLAESQHGLARFLVTRAELRYLDPSVAVKLARHAAEASPKTASFWNTLGMAHYRAGHWKDAITALKRSQELNYGGVGADQFFLAMSYWRLGDQTQAKAWYDRAIAWMAKNQPMNEDYLRFRAEASELLGLTPSR